MALSFFGVQEMSISAYRAQGAVDLGFFLGHLHGPFGLSLTFCEGF